MHEANMQSVMATVIIAAYNCEKYIREAIDSILQQSYKNFELIIIEDASADNTLEVIETYTDSRIQLIRNTENLGQTKSLNIGIKRATGKYILIMDADDIAHPDRLKVQIEFMEKKPNIVLAGTWLKCFGDRHSVYYHELEHNMLRAQMVLNCAISNGTFIIRREILNKYNILYNEHIRYAQDYCLQEEISHYGEVEVIPRILLKYRIHSSQVTTAKAKEQAECADYTRKRVLSELQVHLNEDDFELWSKFCVSSFDSTNEKDWVRIQEIVDLIKQNNIRLGIYNQEALERVLDDRLAVLNVKGTQTTIDEKWFLQIDALSKWLKKYQEGSSLVDYFIEHNYKRIAIYGMAELGKRLVDELEDTPIIVEFFMDKNKGAYYKGIEYRDVKDKVSGVDVMVITPMHAYEAISNTLDLEEGVKLVSLQDVIYDL